MVLGDQTNFTGSFSIAMEKKIETSLMKEKTLFSVSHVSEFFSDILKESCTLIKLVYNALKTFDFKCYT